MSEFVENEGGEGAEVAAGAEMDKVVEQAGSASINMASTAVSLDSATVPEKVADLEVTLEKEVTQTNVKIGEALDLGEKFGSDPNYSNDVIDDASKPIPETPEGGKLKKFYNKFCKMLNIGVETIKTSNGESGNALKDSPKTMSEIFDKYGKYALFIALAIAGLVTLIELGDSMSGCYQVATLSSQSSTPIKVGCLNDTVPNQGFKQCSCQGVKATQCAAPDCGGSNGINYYWQHVSALQALAHLPGMLESSLLNPITKSSIALIKAIAIYGGLFLIIVIIGYYIYKRYSKGSAGTSSKH